MQKYSQFALGVALTALLSLGMARHASAQGLLVTVDENGNGSVQLVAPPGIPIPPLEFPFPGVVAPDTGPGGSDAALTYPFPAPAPIIPGDVKLREPDSSVSDLIRFNPAGPDAITPPTLVFYSDSQDGVDSLADQAGFPTAFYEDNTLTFDETGSEGNNGFLYVPGFGDPGFIVGAPFRVAYQIISDTPSAAPEPGSLALLLTGGLPLLGLPRRRSG